MVGIDQTLVDIEAKVDDDFLQRYGLSAGHSLVIDDATAEALYNELMREQLISHQFAGGTIGNTLHNYSVLADDRSVLLGVMCNNIQIGGYAYRYLCNTSSRMDLNFLQGVDGAIGRCFTLIGEQGERTLLSARPDESTAGCQYSGRGDCRCVGAGADIPTGALSAG